MRINIRDRLIEENWDGRVMGIHNVRAIDRARIGADRNIIVDAENGLEGSFMKSFTPSAIG